MKVILLAAGEGKRLRPHTAAIPKCMVELAGAPLLVHLRQLYANLGIDDLVVVTGHAAPVIEDLGFNTIHNAEFASTNMLASLMSAHELFDGSDDLVISYTDIVYRESVVEALLACDAPIATTVDRQWQRLWEARMDDPLSDAESLRVNEAGDIVELGATASSLDEIQGQYMGLIKVSAEKAGQWLTTYLRLAAESPREARNQYMTAFLQHMIDSGEPLRAVFVDGGWIEVDSTDDLDLFRSRWEKGTLGEFWSPPQVLEGTSE